MAISLADGATVAGDRCGRPRTRRPTSRCIAGSRRSAASSTPTRPRRRRSRRRGGRSPCLGTTHADHFDGPVPVTRAADGGRDRRRLRGDDRRGHRRDDRGPGSRRSTRDAGDPRRRPRSVHLGRTAWRLRPSRGGRARGRDGRADARAGARRLAPPERLRRRHFSASTARPRTTDSRRRATPRHVTTPSRRRPAIEAARLYGAGDLRIVREPTSGRARQRPGAGRRGRAVRVRPPLVRGREHRRRRLDHPLVLGHEFSGRLDDGRLVAADPGPLRVVPGLPGGPRHLCRARASPGTA